MSALSIPEIHAHLEKFYNELIEEDFDLSDTAALKERLRDMYNDSQECAEVTPNRLTGALNQFIKKKNDDKPKQSSSVQRDIAKRPSDEEEQNADEYEKPQSSRKKPTRGNKDDDDILPSSRRKSDSSNHDDDVPEVKPNNTSRGRKPHAKPSLSIEDIVEKKANEGLSTKDVSSKGDKDYVIFPTTQCNHLNISGTNSVYELSKPAKPSKNFPADHNDLTGAEDGYIAFVVGKSDQEAFTAAVSDYQDTIHALREKYRIKATKNKKQKFSYVKPTELNDAKVRYYDPDNDAVVADLPPKEAQPIIEFHDTLSDFTEKWKNQSNTIKVKFLQYLCLDVIRTQNILAFDVLKKIHRDIYEEYRSPLTNTILSTNTNNEWCNASDQLILTNKDVIYSTDYIKLFDALRKLNPKSLGKSFKDIFTLRKGIVLHPACTEEFKRAAWMQAFANMNAFDIESLTEPEQLVFRAWRNVLSSRFAYHIIMNCVHGYAEFEHAMISLIQEGASIKLFESLLYPISFMCTPLMFGHEGFKLTNHTKLLQSKYSKYVSERVNELLSDKLKLTDYDKCFWLFYSNANDGCNVMVELLHNAITQTHVVKEQKPPKTTGKGKGRSKKGKEAESS